MRNVLVGSLTAALVLGLSAAPAAAQPAVVDLKQPKPRAVQSVVFTTDAPQQIRIDATGAESNNDHGTFSWIAAMWTSRNTEQDPWMGNAWILDLNSRKVVWELRRATTQRGRRGSRTFNGPVQLPAGTYEAFYAAYPEHNWTDENGNAGTGQRFINWLTDAGFDDFHLTVQANGRALSGVDAERARRQVEAGAVVALRGDRPERFVQAGFALDRSTPVEILSVGEVREDAQFDSGWIVNVNTRQTVWRLQWRESAPAGGAAKNRVARTSTTLPAGRYAAFYSTDDSHDVSAWNTPPPSDPHAWGLFVRVSDGARAAVKPFAYEHVPAAATLAAITRIGDDESRTRAFTLKQSMNVRVYALGEGSGGELFDYAWITNAATGQKVWEMRYADTEHAGGDRKNRLVDRAIRLEKGDYVLHYASDDSHSYGDWNAAAPYDPAHWGVTVLSVGG